MAEPTGFSETTAVPTGAGVISYPDAAAAVNGDGHKPYVPADETRMPEFTWRAVLVGSALGILFGASSLYLVLKVGMTVSASIPVAVLAITLFRGLSRLLPIRAPTILENNIMQTAGSAGESIAFGVGVTMPALMLIGFEMDITRIMVVSILGGLLGILMMIPLRRAFIVKLHGKPGEEGKLLYPEGTACAQVLISGEKGGTSGKTVFFGFGDRFPPQIRHRGHEPAQDDGGAAAEEVQHRGGAHGRHGFGVARRRLHHRRPHQRHHVRRRRAGVAGDRADDLLLRRGRSGRRGPGRQADFADDHRRHSQRLHALHRRRLRGGGRHHQHVPDIADDYSLLHFRRRHAARRPGSDHREASSEPRTTCRRVSCSSAVCCCSFC